MRTVMLLCLATVAWVAPGWAQEEPTEAKPPVYDAQADAKADITAALKKCKKDNQRVLLVYGANWCGWCVKLDGVFKRNRDIRRKILYEYRIVKVDVGKFDKNMDIAKRHGVDLKQHGIPFLTVLDGNGSMLTNQNTSDLEKGAEHDVEKVKRFLTRWQAEPQDADKLLAAAVARAAQEKKRVFVHLGAPW